MRKYKEQKPRGQHNMGQTGNCDIQADSTPFRAVTGTTIKHTIKDTAQC